MQVFLVIISVVLLGVIIHFLVSSKSSKLLKLVAIIALGFIALSLIVCGIFLIRGPGGDKEAITPPFILESDPQPAKQSNMAMIITFLVVLLLIMGLIVRTTLNEKKKPAKPEIKTDKPKPVEKTKEVSEENVEPATGADDDDLFNLDI